MNPRVSRSSRAREQGDRASRSRRSRPSSRSATRSTRSRTTSPRDAGELRADHRLRRHQDAALGVREAARHDAGARHADAVGRRGHGDRPHVPRVAAEGAALARDRAASGSTAIRPSASSTASTTTSSCARAAVPTPERLFQVEAALRAVRVGRAARTRSPAIDPWFLDQILADRRGARRGSTQLGFDGMIARRLAAGEAARLLRRPARVPVGRRPRPTVRAARLAAGVARHVQDRRHLRGRVRRASTPYHYGTYEDEDEVAPLDEARGRDPRQRARTASARASSSTTAACTPRSRCATPASRP